MKKIPIWKTLILPFLTLGIWNVLWVHKTSQAAQEKTKMQVPSIWFIVWPLIAMIPVIAVVIIGLIDAASAIEGIVGEEARQAALDKALEENTSIETAFTTMFFITIGGLFSQIYYYSKWSKAVSKAMDENIGSTPVALLMILIEWPVGIPYIQSQINKLPEKEKPETKK